MTKRHCKVLGLTAALAAITALAVPAGANDNAYTCGERPAQYVPADAESTSYPVYVASEEAGGPNVWATWIYMESNGAEGLQRHDRDCAHEGWAPDEADFIIW